MLVSEAPYNESMQWIVGLDAIRAFAMFFIVAYHFLHSSGLLTGAFIFIEFFLVVSGYLMASKLIREYYKNGQVSILRFIKERFLRLWPPVVLVMLFSLAAACLTPRELLAGLRQDSLAAVLFSTNIVEAIMGRGYENTISPNLFEHLWFVGLELQLCILLPIILTLTILSASNRKSALRRSLIVTLGIALLSLGLMVVYGGLWQQGDRAYFAPDVQAFGFFAGASLALWRGLHPLKERRRRFGAGLRLVLSLAGLVVLGVILRYGETRAFLWGMPVAALLSTVALSALLRLQRRRAVLPRPLRPIEFLGKYSFGVYLIHYPLMLLLPRVANLALPLRMAIIAVLSILLAFIFDILLDALKQRRIVAIAAVILLAFPAAAALINAPKESPILQEISQNQTERGDFAIRYAQDLNNASLEKFLNEASQHAEEASERAKAEAVTVEAATSANNAKVLVIGDSVTLGAKVDMENLIPGVFVDAEESRGVEKTVPILNQLAASGNIPGVIVISLTTNERYFSDELMQGIVEAARGSRVIFVTGYAGPEQPRESQNEAIRNFADSHDNVYYADWWQISHDNWDLMYADHIHLNFEGRSVYAQLIYNTIMNTGGIQ